MNFLDNLRLWICVLWIAATGGLREADAGRLVGKTS
jgi:hypothetical protein